MYIFQWVVSQSKVLHVYHYWQNQYHNKLLWVGKLFSNE